MTLKNISKLERLNVVSINVYDIENKQVLPLQLISDKEKRAVHARFTQRRAFCMDKKSIPVS